MRNKTDIFEPVDILTDIAEQKAEWEHFEEWVDKFAKRQWTSPELIEKVKNEATLILTKREWKQ